MSRVIHRHSLDIAVSYTALNIKYPAAVLSVAPSRAEPNNYIDLWALTSRDGHAKQVGIYIVGTGWELDPVLATGYETKHIGTVVTPSGLVWHVWQGPVQ